MHSYIHVAIRSIIRDCTASIGLPVANNKVWGVGGSGGGGGGVVGEVELMN